MIISTYKIFSSIMTKQNSQPGCHDVPEHDPDVVLHRVSVAEALVHGRSGLRCRVRHQVPVLKSGRVNVGRSIERNCLRNIQLIFRFLKCSMQKRLRKSGVYKVSGFFFLPAWGRGGECSTLFIPCSIEERTVLKGYESTYF